MLGPTAKRSRANEFVGLLLFALTAVSLLSLLSYDPEDPSFNMVTYRDTFSNYIGKVGAYFSDLILQVFGVAAFLIPVAMALTAWRKIRSLPLTGAYGKAFGLLLFMCTLATGFSLIDTRLPYELKFPLGGLVGTVGSTVLLRNFNLPGSLIVVSTLLSLAILLTTRFSFVGAVERLAAMPGSLVRRYRDWRLDRRKIAAPIKQYGKRAQLPNLASPAGADAAAKPEPQAEQARQERKADAQSAPAIVKREDQVQAARGGRELQAAASAAQTKRKYVFPSIDFLEAPSSHAALNEAELMELAKKLTIKCAEFDVRGSVVQIHPGPVVTTFEFKPDPGVKYSRIVNLVDDICLALKAESIRIDRIPGKSTVGIEVPNSERETIRLRELIESETFRRSTSKLTLALGKLINGEVYVTDLAKMPHLLIAGATGTGKSVAINAMITSILYRSTPDEVKFILIDPKRLELGIYADIPHLLTPIVTDIKQAANALRWATREMEERYRRLAVYSVRNIDQYNALLSADVHDGEEDEQPLPYIVIVIDELADLMLLAGREVEAAITRLAQMARAVGIHLILSTQRPSVDVITGLIKANFPSRIAFRVSSKVDSRTIIDCNGAEQLLGNGDMLFLPPGSARLIRVHGAYVSEKEAQRIIEHLKTQGKPVYDESVLEFAEDERESEAPDIEEVDDELYDEAVRIVLEMRRASTSVLQRRLKIGYGRAARLLDMMEKAGIIGPQEGSKPREVLISRDYFEGERD